MGGDRFEGDSGSRPWAAVEDGHFTEVIAGFHDGETMHAAGDGTGGDLNGAFGEDVEAVAFGTFLEDAGGGGIDALLGALDERTQGIAGEMPGETRFREVHHGDRLTGGPGGLQARSRSRWWNRYIPTFLASTRTSTRGHAPCANEWGNGARGVGWQKMIGNSG